MLNKKLILINAMPHSGSNILWNIVCSHPQICLPRYETSEILDRLPLIGNVIRSRVRNVPFFRPWLAARFDRHCYALKMACLQDPDHCFSEENRLYTAGEIAQTAICLKSLHHELYLSDFLCRVYPDSYCIGLIRNGYAFCNSIIRRGGSADNAGKLYHNYLQMTFELKKKHSNYRLVTFESLLENPFDIARELFTFLGVEPHALPKLRLKSKRVLSPQGIHAVKFGEENRHYWFDKREIFTVLEPVIDTIQKKDLTEKEKRIFEMHTRADLEHLGYWVG